MSGFGGSIAHGSTAPGNAGGRDARGSDGPLSPGQHVDDYRVVRLLGRGGMGEVYLARDTRLGRKVVLKLIKGDGLGTPAAVERFLLEARVTAQFNHPHIVTVYGAGESDGRPYVALEYLDGETLRVRYQDERPSPHEVMRIGRSIADALREAHAHEVLHRDLKPDNVVIPSDGRLRVLDFGLARAFAPPELPSGDQITMTALSTNAADLLERLRTDDGRLAGTPAYMAPEQWHRQPIGSAVDVWALGLILYELLDGEPPYRAYEDQLMDLALRVASPEPVPALARPRGCPVELVDLVGRCLDKDPASRPAADELHRALSALLGSHGAPAEHKVSPFRGLLPFTERQAALFFGRDAEIDALVEQLREVPVMTVVGPSGAGKSSLVRAGVLPRLGELGSWRVLHLRPGGAPFETLASRLLGVTSGTESSDPLSKASLPDGASRAAAHAEVDELADALVAAPGRLALRLERMAREQGGVVLFVDQLEELDTYVQDDSVRTAFLRALAGGADDPAQPVRVITTVRDDFLGRLADLQAGADVLGRIVVLGAPGTEAMREALIRPLEAVGYRWEDDGIVAEMVTAVERESAALPLLQFAADALWQKRDRQRRQLTRAAYEEIGGVEGALASQAEQVLGGMTPEQVEFTRRLFLHLVSSRGTRRTVERAVLLSELGASAGDVLDRWVAARLLTLRRGAGGKPSVELAHESLVGTWGQLRRWLDESREERAFLEEIRQAAELWQRRARPDDEVWIGEALWEAERKLAKTETRSALVEAFVAAGRRREGRRRRQRRWLWGAVVGALGLVAIGAVIVALELVSKNRQIEARRAEAVAKQQEADARRAESLVETAERAWGAGNVLGARARTRVALELGDDLGARGVWLRLREDPLRWRRDVTCQQWAPRLLAFPPGDSVLHNCNSFDRLSMDTAEQRPLGSHHVFSTVAASRRRPRAALFGQLGTLRIFDTDSGRLLVDAKLGVDDDIGSAVALDASAHWAALGYMSGRVRLFALSPPEARLLGEDRLATTVLRMALAPDGRLLAAVAKGTGLQVWSREPLERRSWGDPCPRFATRVDFAPDEPRLYVACDSGDVAIVDTASGQAIERLAGVELRGVPFAMRALSAGRMVTTGSDRRVARWDIATGRRTNTAPVLKTPAKDIVTSPDGRWLAVANEQEVAVLRTEFKEPSESLPGHRSALTTGIALDRTGAYVASGDAGGVVTIWDAATGEPVRVVDNGGREVSDLAFRSDGTELVGVVRPDTLRVWRVPDGDVLRELRVPNARSVAVTEGGETLVAGYGTGKPTTITAIAPSGKAAAGPVSIPEASLSATFAPDPSKVALFGVDRSLRVVDTRSGESLWTVSKGLVGTNQIVWWSPDGRRLAFQVLVGDRVEVVLCDAASGRELHRAASSHDGGVAGVALSDAVLMGGTTWRWATGEQSQRPGEAKLAYAFDPERRRIYGIDVGGWLAYRDLDGPPLVRAQRVDRQRVYSGGWWELRPTGAAALADPPVGDWYRAIAERGFDVYVGADGELGCLLTTDWQIELWDLVRRQRLARHQGEPGEITLGRPFGERGCLFGRRSSPTATTVALLRLDRGGKTHAVVDDVVFAYGIDPYIVTGTAGRLDIRTSDGTPLQQLSLDGSLAAVAASSRGGLWLLFDDGRLHHVSRDGATTQTSLLGVGAAHPSALYEGPTGTVAIGFSDGRVGLWSAATGRKLWTTQLRGMVRELWIDDDTLYGLTETGDTLAQSLWTFTASRCELLAEVWHDTSVVWSSGRTQVAPPDPAHPCYGTYRERAR